MNRCITLKEYISVDFEIALIGCGSLGMPFGAYIKSYIGEKAIDMNSDLQLLFGIADREFIIKGFGKAFGNDSWIIQAS